MMQRFNIEKTCGRKIEINSWVRQLKSSNNKYSKKKPQNGWEQKQFIQLYNNS